MMIANRFNLYLEPIQELIQIMPGLRLTSFDICSKWTADLGDTLGLCIRTAQCSV